MVIGALTAVPPLVTDLYLPGLPAMARDMGSSESMAQMTMSVCLVGLALGQLVVGPLSDRVGRIPPLRWGVALLAVTSLLCALAPSLPVLLAARLLQGLAGSAAVVVARAIVRDVYAGPRLAKVFSELMLVMGLAPAAGPVVGGQLLRITDWRGIFVVLMAISALLLAAVLTMLHETRPASAGDASVRTTTALATLVRDRSFMPFVAITSCAGIVLFSYIGMSPFVLQDDRGLSVTAYSLVFGTNAIGIVIGSQVNARLVMRLGPRTLLHAGLTLLVVAGALVSVAQALDAPTVVMLVPLWFCLVGFSGIMGNASALAMEHQGGLAGTASALLGSCSFLFGALVPPIISTAGTGGATMGLTMTAASVLGLLTLLLLAPRPRS